MRKTNISVPIDIDAKETISRLHKRYLAFAIAMMVLTLASQAQHSTLRNPLSSVSAVGTNDMLRIYWDGNCTQPVSSISWGVLSPGGSKRFSFYVRNEGNMTVSLVLSAGNWIPSNASKYLFFSWRSNNRTAEIGKTAKADVNLYVSRNIAGIVDFSFDVAVGCVRYVRGDANNDCVVDVLDIVTIGAAYGSTPSVSNWNLYADLNFDKSVDLFDLVVVSAQFGKS